uniref:Fucosyltransferase n=1 Tax=Syphacia muris TaxID=451379 RepID=A0A0N5ATZ6_9BILA
MFNSKLRALRYSLCRWKYYLALWVIALYCLCIFADGMSYSAFKVGFIYAIILSWNAGHSESNLGGCLDWNCNFSGNKKDLPKADAIITMFMDKKLSAYRRPDQYIIFFNQESPVYGSITIDSKLFFNSTLNFRRDSITSSPYGYTVKLAPQSKPKQPVVDEKLIQKKSKAIAWFVSHCSTSSLRELYINELQKFIEVDVYGSCGNLKCARGGECEEVLDTDYHFYVAFENSICKDYITEKLWNQGYQRTIVPLVLKREYVEPFAPPYSFIAVDDFNTVQELAQYLNYLIGNKTAYMEYFEWRKEYKVIFLNGAEHDFLERPWGFCQICRLLWQNPLQKHVIKDFNEYWSKSCETSGSLVQQLIKQSAINETS